MTATETASTGLALPDKGPISVRTTPEQRAALEWLQKVFSDKYAGISSVLTDYSLREAEMTWRRAQDVAEAA
jgi:hypothetical protein